MGEAGYQYSYPNLRLEPAPFAEDGRPQVVYGPLNIFDSTPDPADFVVPAGRITQTYDRETYTIVNTALRDHVFCCGTITRGPEQIGGTIFLTTRGVGPNTFTDVGAANRLLDRLNQRQGPIIFRALDQQALQYFERTYGD